MIKDQLAIRLSIRYHCAMKIVTSEFMSLLDSRAMLEGGMPGCVPMENAGRAVFETLAERFGPVAGRAFTVACGTGNNGGDGFVVARYLRLAGASVQVLLPGDPKRISGDARTHFEAMSAMGLIPVSNGTIQGIAVDALLGTGGKGAPRADVAAMIETINNSPEPVVAVDVPSGVDSTTGAAPGAAVRANVTVTFAYPKIGLYLSPGGELAGEIVVKNIGFDWESLKPETPFRLLTPYALGPMLPRRPADAHKGTFGHVMVLGGSEGMAGAPAMTAAAALKSGAGLATAAVPASCQSIVAAWLREAMTAPLPDKEGALSLASFDRAREIAERCDAICMGPGAGDRTEARALIVKCLRHIDKPTVLDADGLNALSEVPDALVGRSQPTVLTPHPGECARLIGTNVNAIQSDRLGAVRETAGRYASVVVLKGRHTLIADGRPGGNAAEIPISVSPTGNSGMATGGSGDSLTGIIGALLARGIDAYDAACLGAFLHGLSGDIAAQEKTETCMMAGDIIDNLPRAFARLEDNR